MCRPTLVGYFIGKGPDISWVNAGIGGNTVDEVGSRLMMS